jgi:hypothetical protein
MEISDFLKDNWAVVSAAPLTFILFAIVIASVSVGLTRAVMGGTLEANRERLKAAKEEVARLKDQKDELIKRLGAHGEDIAKLKSDLAALPRIHVSNRPPGPGDLSKDGDVWLQYDQGSSPRHHAQREQLGSFLLEAQALTARANEDPAPLAAHDDWVARVEYYLAEALDSSYVARFGNFQGMTFYISNPNSGLKKSLEGRSRRLHEFIAELAGK